MRPLALLLAAASLAAQTPVAVPADADRDRIVELAATVRPSPRQLAWQATGCNAFVHFGMNTFTDREWGDGKETPQQFAPTAFDADQWVATFRAAGMTGLVLTCKHHDGFCLWPSEATAHDVAASPWRDGKGDVVREVAEACKRGGMKFGVYLSPWDRHEPSFGTAAYQGVFMTQLRELCANYGPLFEVWFDGAHCPPDDPSIFDWQAVFGLVRELQPDAVIAITGPDVRWVGNEAGKTRTDEWSVLPLPSEAPGPVESDRASWRALWALRERNQEQELGSRKALAGARGLLWWPAETDVSIRPGWFHHPAEDRRVKPLETLLEYWYGAVGGNAVLLLNVPADRRGLIPEPDAAVLADLGDVLRATFGEDLGTGGETKVYPKALEVYCKAPTTVDVFDLGEDVGAAGQQVEAFRIEALQNGGWSECARGTTIGFRRILRTEPITAEGFRVWIEKNRGKPKLAHLRLHRRPGIALAPSIARGRDGNVEILGAAPLRFTTDGSPVTATSPTYAGPFALPDGGTVRARSFAQGDGPALRTAGEAAATFGLDPSGWRIVECSSEQGGAEAAAKAIDGDPRTHWHTRWSPDNPKPPHHLTVDLGKALDLTGFVYQPRAEGSNGSIAQYEFYGSADGNDWRKLAAGEFGNIAANPVARAVRFGEVARGTRFVKFVSLRECEGRAWASCAELSVTVR
ncbi:MAG: Sialidase precursor [Planctomycetota bacterium]|jgi:alpha-L-fucosidase